MFDTPIPVSGNATYIVVSYHRGNPTNHKSVWKHDISWRDELECFKNAYFKNWIVPNQRNHFGWGILKPYREIGIGNLPTRKGLFVAKFKDDNKDSQFHGYPVDYTRNEDRVPKHILKEWKNEEIISKSQMARMGRQIECL